MNTVTLLLGIHNHQPDGNFDEVFATGYDDCYVRIIAALEEAPHVRVSLHHTGPLLEWIEAHRPAYLKRMRALVDRGQVEVLGGAFYEPMLAVLPERDARGQIAMMREFTARHFGVRPEGMWLAERVWEPGLPLLLSSAGVKFTLIDDGHFRYAGVDGPLEGYYVTEKAGAPIAIFPIEQKLRYAIPFAPASEAIKTILDLREAHGPKDIVVTYGDDGEKFGMWPGTKEWVWDKGWLREFFRLLGQHKDEIRTAHFSEVLTRFPSGRVYLPTASYEEMGEWALPAKAQERYHEVRHAIEARGELERARAFLRGGIWQGFLSKYPEANFMHKKMIAVSDKVALAVEKHPDHADENQLMTRELYRAQCNCSYWHGLFGGLYLNYLRDAVYRHLLVAEAFADAALGRPAPSWATGRASGESSPGFVVEERDVDADLAEEVFFQTDALDVVVRPHEGGAIQELAYRPKTFMLSNVLARHPEGYHQRLRDYAARGGHGDETGQPKSIHDIVKVKEPGLEKFLIYDRGSRLCFVDRFLPLGTTLAQFADESYEELGDFAGGRYARVAPGKGSVAIDPASAHVADLVRYGKVRGCAVRIVKVIAVVGARLSVRYTITSPTPSMEEPLEVLFVPELSLTLLDGHSQERTYRLPDRDLPAAERVLASRGALSEVTTLSLVNDANRFRVDLGFGGARPTVWRFPLETVSMSEGGFERTYQGSVVAPLFPIKLAAGVPVDVEVSVELADT